MTRVELMRGLFSRRLNAPCVIKRLLIFLLAVCGLAESSFSQSAGRYPSVASIFDDLDVDQDQVLTKVEVVGSRYANQYRRWDVDGDGQVSRADVIKFRKRFGIAADGTQIKTQVRWAIPNPSDLPVVDRDHPPSREVAGQSAYILRTSLHPVSGEQYVILTDHTGDRYLAALKRLAQHHGGKMIHVEHLPSLYKDAAQWNKVQAQLVNARFVAIAPQQSSFTENTLLGMWKLLAGIDSDSMIDVWPGLLIASNEEAFDDLVDQSIHSHTVVPKSVKPLAISQVRNSRETRSLQKAGLLRKLFEEEGIKLPVVSIYGAQADNAPELEEVKTWNLRLKNDRQFIRRFPVDVIAELNSANLWIMHGHGIPGMSCSVDIDGLPESMTGTVVLSHSCFSASPWNSDLPRMTEAPGGYDVEKRDAFLLRAIDRGAVLAFGHQRLSTGFPHLYPVLDSLLEGKTAGQAYQELLNALIDYRGLEPDDFLLSDTDRQETKPLQNILLYVLIGDPAFRLTTDEVVKP